MSDRTPKELLKEIFHFSYNVYSMDATIEKLEQLQEKLPVKDVFGSFNPEYVEVNGVKSYMDECNLGRY